MSSQKVSVKLREVFEKLEWFCKKIFAPLVTPAFAVLNYFVLEAVIKEGSWYRTAFLLLSIVYFLVTLVLACILIYKNIKEPKS